MSEEAYGGDAKIFSTEEAAQAFADKRVSETDSKIDFIVQKIDYENYRPTRDWVISAGDKANTVIHIRIESSTDEICDHLMDCGVAVDDNELHKLIYAD